jgi:signal transduction histidine kinase
MTDLVENLLSLARADGGAETIVLVPIRVDDLFRQVTESWKDGMNRALLGFSIETEEEDLALLGDRHLLPRLLSILLENASKYTPPGGSVKLSATPVGARVVLSVTDSGIGIAPEHKPRIFERFYRATKVGEPAPPGSGLGLALAKWIAERHGTKLLVESEPGCGSCFSFSLEKTHLTVQPGRAVGALLAESGTGSTLPSCQAQ